MIPIVVLSLTFIIFNFKFLYITSYLGQTMPLLRVLFIGLVLLLIWLNAGKRRDFFISIIMCIRLRVTCDVRDPSCSSCLHSVHWALLSFNIQSNCRRPFRYAFKTLFICLRSVFLYEEDGRRFTCTFTIGPFKFGMVIFSCFYGLTKMTLDNLHRALTTTTQLESPLFPFQIRTRTSGTMKRHQPTTSSRALQCKRLVMMWNNPH